MNHIFIFCNEVKSNYYGIDGRRDVGQDQEWASYLIRQDQDQDQELARTRSAAGVGQVVTI